MIQFTDTHAHLDEYVKSHELESILERAEAARVNRIITIGTCREDWELYAKLHAQYPQKIQYTVGLHPCYVDAKWEEDLDLIKSFFSPQSPYP